ncbi:MAG: nucleotidyltransferase family protein [Tabrizicola sp.]|nr:nucleotidyltransferase family protein [Tabrizicola sp.]
MVTILILAAGASSRMRGQDKLVTQIDGKALLRRVAESAVATGSPILVTLPPAAMARRDVLQDLPLHIVEVPDAELGMSRSLVHAIKHVADRGPTHQDGLMILPGDMPGFTTDALARLIARFQAAPHAILRGGSEAGDPGHPTIFPCDLWAELSQVTGDEGGKSVLKRHSDRVEVVPLPGQMATLDLDTPEDWAAYLGHPPVWSA